MKKWMLVLMLAVTPALFSGCLLVDPEEKEPQKEKPDPKPETSPILKATVLSGHMGNDWDCPSSVGGAVEGDFACEPDENGGCVAPPLNCDDPQVIVKITNAGEVDAEDLQVARIERLVNDQLVEEYALIEVLDDDSRENFSGTIEANDDATIIIKFAEIQVLGADGDSDGLRADGDQALPGNGTILSITIEASNHDDLEIETMELYELPSVDT